LACFGVSALRARLAFSIAHVSASLPAIPDGRISRVRFWPWLTYGRLPGSNEA